MAQSLGDEKMEELLQNNLGVTFELLNQLDNAISCYTIVSVWIGWSMMLPSIPPSPHSISAWWYREGTSRSKLTVSPP